jgi:hypothetical protein
VHQTIPFLPRPDDPVAHLGVRVYDHAEREVILVMDRCTEQRTSSMHWFPALARVVIEDLSLRNVEAYRWVLCIARPQIDETPCIYLAWDPASSAWSSLEHRTACQWTGDDELPKWRNPPFLG